MPALDPEATPDPTPTPTPSDSASPVPVPVQGQEPNPLQTRGHSGRRLTTHQIVEALAMRAGGATVTDIAARLTCSTETAYRIVTQYESSTDLASKFLNGHALKAAKGWAKAIQKGAERGRHEPARDLLLHTGAIQPVSDPANSGAKVAVFIGVPGQHQDSDRAKPQHLVVDVQATTPASGGDN